MNEAVLATLHASGHGGVRMSHGYVVQHLIGGHRSITELAGLMGVTQQAASKVVGELAGLGYVENAPSEDARVRRARLSSRGQSMLEATRKIRARAGASLLRGVPRNAVRQARGVLLSMLERLGGTEALGQRRARMPTG